MQQTPADHPTSDTSNSQIPYLTTTQAAKLLNVTDLHVSRLIRQGRLKAQKFSTVWLIKHEELLRYKKWRKTAKLKLGRPPGPVLPRPPQADAATGSPDVFETMKLPRREIASILRGHGVRYYRRRGAPRGWMLGRLFLAANAKDAYLVFRKYTAWLEQNPEGVSDAEK